MKRRRFRSPYFIELGFLLCFEMYSLSLDFFIPPRLYTGNSLFLRMANLLLLLTPEATFTNKNSISNSLTGLPYW